MALVWSTEVTSPEASKRLFLKRVALTARTVGNCLCATNASKELLRGVRLRGCLIGAHFHGDLGLPFRSYAVTKAAPDTYGVKGRFLEPVNRRHWLEMWTVSASLVTIVGRRLYNGPKSARPNRDR